VIPAASSRCRASAPCGERSLHTRPPLHALSSPHFAPGASPTPSPAPATQLRLPPAPPRVCTCCRRRPSRARRSAGGRERQGLHHPAALTLSSSGAGCMSSEGRRSSELRPLEHSLGKSVARLRCLTARGHKPAATPRGARARATSKDWSSPRGGAAEASAEWRAQGNARDQSSGEDLPDKLGGRSRSLVGRRYQLHQRRAATRSRRPGGGGLDRGVARRYASRATADLRSTRSREGGRRTSCAAGAGGWVVEAPGAECGEERAWRGGRV